MHTRLIAVGGRQPAWVDTATAAYADRLPRNWRFRIDNVVSTRRTVKGDPDSAKTGDSRNILVSLGTDEFVVLLDEQGVQLTSRSLATSLSAWQEQGRDLCFVIGGPDGVTDRIRERADFIWSLSDLTLPHGLARVVLVEQLYRSWSLLSGHPYHRN